MKSNHTVGSKLDDTRLVRIENKLVLFKNAIDGAVKELLEEFLPVNESNIRCRYSMINHACSVVYQVEQLCRCVYRLLAGGDANCGKSAIRSKLSVSCQLEHMSDSFCCEVKDRTSNTGPPGPPPECKLALKL